MLPWVVSDEAVDCRTTNATYSDDKIHLLSSSDSCIRGTSQLSDDIIGCRKFIYSLIFLNVEQFACLSPRSHQCITLSVTEWLRSHA